MHKKILLILFIISFITILIGLATEYMLTSGIISSSSQASQIDKCDADGDGICFSSSDTEIFANAIDRFDKLCSDRDINTKECQNLLDRFDMNTNGELSVADQKQCKSICPRVVENSPYKAILDLSNKESSSDGCESGIKEIVLNNKGCFNIEGNFLPQNINSSKSATVLFKQEDISCDKQNEMKPKGETCPILYQTFNTTCAKLPCNSILRASCSCPQTCCTNVKGLATEAGNMDMGKPGKLIINGFLCWNDNGDEIRDEKEYLPLTTPIELPCNASAGEIASAMEPYKQRAEIFCKNKKAINCNSNKQKTEQPIQQESSPQGITNSACINGKQGDFDCNGVCDMNDFKLWLDERTTPAKCSVTDVNKDGKCSLRDYVFWKKCYEEK